MPIFSGIDSVKDGSKSSIVNTAKVIVAQKTVSPGYANDRPAMRISGRNSFSTPSILDALKDQPNKDETGRLAESDANNYSISGTVHPFSQQELIVAWKTFVEKIDAPLLKSALNAREPVLTDEWQIEYELDSEIQFNRITLEIKPKLLGFLRRFFKNEAIEILFTVSSDDNYHYIIPYTDTEKWSLLVEKYPALASLKSKFGLDFEHF